MGLKINGLNEFQKKINDLAKKAEELDGEHNVSFAELFNENFMIKYTKFASMQTLMDSCGLKMDTEKQVKQALETEQWEEYIRENTNFSSWTKMQEQAASEYFAKQLGFK